MRHRHVTVTLAVETVSDIEANLESGETVSAWVAEAAQRWLAGDGAGENRDPRPPYEFVDDGAI